jgi:hypothetical protein
VARDSDRDSESRILQVGPLADTSCSSHLPEADRDYTNCLYYFLIAARINGHSESRLGLLGTAKVFIFLNNEHVSRKPKHNLCALYQPRNIICIIYHSTSAAPAWLHTLASMCRIQVSPRCLQSPVEQRLNRPSISLRLVIVR